MGANFVFAIILDNETREFGWERAKPTNLFMVMEKVSLIHVRHLRWRRKPCKCASGQRDSITVVHFEFYIIEIQPKRSGGEKMYERDVIRQTRLDKF